MVLALVREGRYDAEIAVRLGLSNEEVKRRIAAICTKLGVADRASLRGDVTAGFASTDDRDDWSPIIDATIDPLPRESAPPESYEPVEAGGRNPFLAIVGMLVALGVAALAAWWTLGPGSKDAAPDLPPAVSITDDPGTIIAGHLPDAPDAMSTQMAAYVDPFRGVPAIPATLAGKSARQYQTDLERLADTLAGTSGTPVPGAPNLDASAPLPAGVELLLLRGSTADGPFAVERAFVGDDGAVVMELLLEAPAGRRILAVRASPNGDSLVAAVCVDCPGQAGASAGDKELQFLRSDDAGVTWSAIGSRWSGAPFSDWKLLAVLPGDVVIRKGLQLPQLLSTGGLACGTTTAVFIAAGPSPGLATQAPGTNDLVDCLGAVLRRTGLTGNLVFDDVRFDPGNRQALSFHTTIVNTPRNYLALFSDTETRLLQVPGPTRVAGWLSERLAIGDIQAYSSDRSITPALIDFEGRITLLEAPLRAMTVTQAAGLPEDERPPQVLEVLAVRMR